MNKINKQSLPENIRTVGTSTKSIPVGPTSSVTRVHNGVFLCLSVDSERHTWEGKQLVLVDGSYSISTEVTKGLTYTSSSEVVPPKPGGIYSADGLLQIAEVAPSPNTDAVVDYIDPYAWETMNRLVPNNDKYDFIRFNGMPYCKLHEDNSWSTTVLAIPVEDSPRTIMFSAAVSPHNSEDYKYSLLTYGADQSKFRVYLHNGVLKVGASDTVSDSDIAATNPIADVTKIHTYAVSYDGSQITMYCDGELILSANIQLSTQHGSLVLGCSGDSNTDGKALLGRVIIYNKALSQDIIKEKLSLFIPYSIQIPLNGSFNGTLNGIPTEFNPSVTGFTTGITQQRSLLLERGTSYKLSGITLDKLFDNWLAVGVESTVSPAGQGNYAIDGVFFSDIADRTILCASKDFIFALAIEGGSYKVKLGDGTRWLDDVVFKFNKPLSDDKYLKAKNGTPQSIAIRLTKRGYVDLCVDGLEVGRFSCSEPDYSNWDNDIELQLGDSSYSGSVASVKIENITLGTSWLRQYTNLANLTWSDKSYCLRNRGSLGIYMQNVSVQKMADGPALFGVFSYNYQNAAMLVSKNPLSCMMYREGTGISSATSFEHNGETYYYSVWRNDIPLDIYQSIVALPVPYSSGIGDILETAKALLDYEIPRGTADFDVQGITAAQGGGLYSYSKEKQKFLSDYTLGDYVASSFTPRNKYIYRVKYHLAIPGSIDLDGNYIVKAGVIKTDTSLLYRYGDYHTYIRDILNGQYFEQLYCSAVYAPIDVIGHDGCCEVPAGCRTVWGVLKHLLPVWWTGLYPDPENYSNGYKITVLPGGSYHANFRTRRRGISYIGTLFINTDNRDESILTGTCLASNAASGNSNVYTGSSFISIPTVRGKFVEEWCNVYDSSNRYFVGSFQPNVYTSVYGTNPWLTGVRKSVEYKFVIMGTTDMWGPFQKSYGVAVPGYSTDAVIYIDHDGSHCVAYNEANKCWDLFLGPYDIPDGMSPIVLASLYDVPADQVPYHGPWVKPDGTPL